MDILSKGLFTYDISQKWRGPDHPPPLLSAKFRNWPKPPPPLVRKNQKTIYANSPTCQKSDFDAFFLKENFLSRRAIHIKTIYTY